MSRVIISDPRLSRNNQITENDPVLMRAMHIAYERRRKSQEREELSDRFHNNLHFGSTPLKKTLSGLFIGLPTSKAVTLTSPPSNASTSFVYLRRKSPSGPSSSSALTPAKTKYESPYASKSSLSRRGSSNSEASLFGEPTRQKATNMPRVTRALSASRVRFTEPPPRIDVFGKRRPYQPLEEGVIVIESSDNHSILSDDRSVRSLSQQSIQTATTNASETKWSLDRSRRQQLLERLSRPFISENAQPTIKIPAHLYQESRRRQETSSSSSSSDEDVSALEESKEKKASTAKSHTSQVRTNAFVVNQATDSLTSKKLNLSTRVSSADIKRSTPSTKPSSHFSQRTGQRNTIISSARSSQTPELEIKFVDL